MTEKLQKVLARAGFGSRREIETWIAKGRIKVNGKVAVVGDRVTDDDKIIVDGKKLAPQKKIREDRRVILYNKPENEVSTRSDPEGRRTHVDPGHQPNRRAQSNPLAWVGDRKLLRWRGRIRGLPNASHAGHRAFRIR